jgi:ParB family chromosome partitioning protein
LGKGLDALIPAEAEEGGPPTGVLQVPVEDIVPNPRQPRRSFGEEELRELAESIREHGVLQPLIVKPAEEDEPYELIAGERRLQGAKMAGLPSVPVIVRQVSEQAHLELALIENLQRTDLNPLEAAEGYRQLAEDFELSHEAIAERVGKSRTAVSNTLRLLKLGPSVQQALWEGKITEGHARALLGLPSAQAQSAALRTVLKSSLNVRQTEDLVRRLNGERKAKPRPRKRSPELADLEAQLREALGTKVTLQGRGRGGRVVIHYYSDEELNALIERLLEGATGHA